MIERRKWMKVFEFPTIEIIELNYEDVLYTSPGGGLEDEENGAGWVS